jgi:hypothetical protein
MVETTILYYTDGTLVEDIARVCRQHLMIAAHDKPIISISQSPMVFGTNINVGPLPHNHHSMFYQTALGAAAAQTKYIAFAEHDCLYTREHFNFVPPSMNVFYYNVNSWFVQWHNEKAGEYSYYRRRPMSQLICSRDLYLRAVSEKLSFLANGDTIAACEPGVKEYRQAMLRDDVGKAAPWQASHFHTVAPTLDIRHSTNFSGPRLNSRRATGHTYDLPPWGKFAEIMNA